MPIDARDNRDVKLEKELNLAEDFPLPTYEEWRTCAEESLKGAAFEKLVSKTYEDIDLQPIYTEKDIDCTKVTETTGDTIPPREICQEINTPDPHQFNEALKHALNHGQNSIHLLLAPPHIKQKFCGGLSISTLEDLSTALADIDIEKYPIHIIPGFSGLEILMMLAAFLKQEKKDIGKIKGSIDTDPLGFLAVHGELPVSLADVFDGMARGVKWAGKNAPGLKTIGVCGLPYHNAGADAVRELAYVLASAVEYTGQLLERDNDLTVDDIAGSMRFTLGIGPFYFMEIAKIRAARMLWAQIIAAWGGSEASQKMTVHARTSSYNQTRYDPHVNMLRTTTEAFSAVVAGVESLQTNPFDEVFGGGDEFSRRVARNTQILLNEECHLDPALDAAGGSYYIEKLTDEVAGKAWQKFQEIEARGGMLKALQEGFPQKEIEAVAQKRREDIATRKSLLVGTNFSVNANEKKPAFLSGTAVGPDSESKKSEAFIKIKPLKLHRAAEMFEESRDKELP